MRRVLLVSSCENLHDFVFYTGAFGSDGLTDTTVFSWCFWRRIQY